MMGTDKMLSLAEVSAMPMAELFEYALPLAPKNGGSDRDYRALHELIRAAGRRDEYSRHQAALLRTNEMELMELRREAAHLVAVIDMEEGELRPVFSSKLGPAFEQGVIQLGEKGVADGDLTSLPPLSQVFLLHHDWTRVLEGSEADEGDVMLPFPSCLFEASIGRVRVAVALVTPEGAGEDTFSGADKFVLWEVVPDPRCVGGENGARLPDPFWVVDQPEAYEGRPTKPLMDALLNKARLACIALESGLAESTLSRPRRNSTSSAPEAERPLSGTATW